MKRASMERLFGEDTTLERLHLMNRAWAALAEQPLYKTIVRLQSLGVIIRADEALCKPECRSVSGRARILLTRRRTVSASTECFAYRCSTCRKVTSLLQNSFLSLFRKPLEIVLQAIKCWSVQFGVERTETLLGLKEKSVVTTRLFAVLTQIAATSIRPDDIRLGWCPNFAYPFQHLISSHFNIFFGLLRLFFL